MAAFQPKLLEIPRRAIPKEASGRREAPPTRYMRGDHLRSRRTTTSTGGEALHHLGGLTNPQHHRHLCLRSGATLGPPTRAEADHQSASSMRRSVVPLIWLAALQRALRTAMSCSTQCQGDEIGRRGNGRYGGRRRSAGNRRIPGHREGVKIPGMGGGRPSHISRAGGLHAA